jgi:oligoribonuclease
MSSRNPKNLIWLDLEMTGLSVEKEAIIEIATIATDPELNILEEGPCLVVHQEDELLDKMDDWNMRHHGASGLIEKVKNSKISAEDAEAQTIEFVRRYGVENKTLLCGNTIGQDRKFLLKYMKKLHNFFHYRSVDVTSIKELVLRWYPDGPKLPKKNEAHQALIDIRESIDELKFYRKHYFVPASSNGTGSNPPEESSL